MPKRPRSHEIEDITRRRLRDIFGTCGWVVWDLYPDYGEDFLVRIFTDAIATHFSFFVQAKGTDTINNSTLAILSGVTSNLNEPVKKSL